MDFERHVLVEHDLQRIDEETSSLVASEESGFHELLKLWLCASTLYSKVMKPDENVYG